MEWKLTVRPSPAHTSCWDRSSEAGQGSRGSEGSSSAANTEPRVPLPPPTRPAMRTGSQACPCPQRRHGTARKERGAEAAAEVRAPLRDKPAQTVAFHCTRLTRVGCFQRKFSAAASPCCSSAAGTGFGGLEKQCAGALGALGQSRRPLSSGASLELAWVPRLRPVSPALLTSGAGSPGHPLQQGGWEVHGTRRPTAWRAIKL